MRHRRGVDDDGVGNHRAMVHIRTSPGSGDDVVRSVYFEDRVVQRTRGQSLCLVSVSTGPARDGTRALLLPVMLCLALVFVGKARVAQIETERIAEDEEQARYRTMTDGLTGLPNRAQFLECIARAIQQSGADRDFLQHRGTCVPGYFPGTAGWFAETLNKRWLNGSEGCLGSIQKSDSSHEAC